jgi:Zn-dependent protease with chaperone function
MLRSACVKSGMRAPRLPSLLVLAALALAPATASLQADDKEEKVDGYAEWRRNELLVVDGQRLRATPATKVKGKHARTFDAIPLGFRVEAKGRRDASGVILVESIEAKPNDMAFLENEVLKATTAMEQQWLAGQSVTLGANDKPAKLFDSGADVERARRIMQRLLPPYLKAGDVRTRVVERNEWNAFAMGNGAVFVHTGLMHDMNDDELAIILGHELAHYTHEHSRKGMKRAMIVQLIAAGVAVAAETSIENDQTKQVVGLAAVFSSLALTNGYGRDLEDQADRVGLRYAHEGGFDVTRGPRVWERFRQKYGEENRVANFFFSNHSQSGARQRNLSREILLNYPSSVSAAQ